MGSASFREVFERELACIAVRRRALAQDCGKVPQESDERKLQEFALDQELFGLSFSGGGIRSASFNLGVLQQLARYGLLRHVDYLSTVSGGGYIGAWLAAWLKREGHRRAPEVFNNVEQQLIPKRTDEAKAERATLEKGRAVDNEPEPIHHLRAYTRYLSPQFGFFSADSWTLIAIYLRNLLLNQLLLFFTAVAALLLTRLLVWFFNWNGIVTWNRGGFTETEIIRWIMLVVAIVCCLVAIVMVARELLRRRNGKLPTAGASREIGLAQTHALVLVPFLVGALSISWLYSTPTAHIEKGTRISKQDLRLPVLSDVLYLRPENKSLQEARDGKTPWGAVSVLALVFGSTYGLINLVVLLSQIQREKILNAARKALREILAGVVCGAVVGLLLVVFLAKVIWPYLGYPQSPSLTVALGPPLVLLAFVVGAFAEIGILGRSLSEPEREYWSRIGAWSLIYAVIWLGVFGLTLGGQYAFYQAQDYFHTRAAVGWGSFASWFVATALGALAGRSRATGAGKASRLIEWFGALVPYIFIAGLAVFASVATTEFLGPEPWEKAPTRLVPQVWAVVNNLDMTRFLWLGGVCAMGILVLMLCVDVNLFSLHALYANRLVRCYLGASRYKSQWDQRKPKGASTGVQMPARVEDRMTGMDADDDLPLRLLTIGYESGGDGRVKPTTYWGPYLLINTALNMVSGAELAWQDRKAVSFVLSPRHCGSQTTGYATLCEDADEYLTLGRAMAISGAAASPNMGYHSSPGLTAVMAVFNMRLGWWIQNPNYNWGGSGPKTWQARGPGPGPWFMDELLGLTNDTSKFVYLSDGGHFENLGLYELVRRRCKYIIVCDASADPQYHFEDLAGAIRKCRTDFGVRIQIDVCNLPAKGRRKCHCVAGRIYYSDVHDGEQKEKHDGLLLYIKASLTGDEPADVRQYAASHPDFPHEATVDQFFSEAQFESYRALGYHVAGNMLGERRGEVGPHGDTIGHWDIPALFHDLYNEWVPLPGGTAEDFYKSVEQYLAVQDALRTDPKLTELSHELYSAVFEKLPGPTSPTELHMVLRLLQVMEIAFAQVGLDEYDDHAKKMGWVDVLQHWARSPTMQRYWPYIKGEFGLGFQRYFERISRAPSDREPHKARERD